MEVFFRKFSSEVEKMHHVELNSGTSNQVSKKSLYRFEDIDLRESHAKLHKTPSETLGAG